MNVAQETLGFRRAGLSPALSLLMSAFALPIPPARVTPHLHRPTERSPTICRLHQAHSARATFPLRRAVSTLMGALPLRRFAPQRQAPCASALGGACKSAISVPSLSPV